MRAKTKLTVFIPTYNRVRSLEVCLKGLAAQIGQRKDVRVHVSDNASEDGTDLLLALYKKQYPWLSYERNRWNRGGVFNQLKAFSLPFESEFVWMIGDDDYVVQDAIEDLCNIIDLDASFDVIFCNTMAFAVENKQKVIEKYLNVGGVDEGAYKSKVHGEFLTTFPELINPVVADSYLIELMCLCFRQSFVQPETIKKVQEKSMSDTCANNPNTTFEKAGDYYSGGVLPLLEQVTTDTVCFYSQKPRTFNFWGSADWLVDYDYVFVIALLHIISYYRKRKLIDNNKTLLLLKYYFSMMSPSIQRQLTGQSKARPFTADQHKALAKHMSYYITGTFADEL
jgi:glycosyltransferase involved in cell wall biosynthesis